ncbi:MAG: cytidylate kinase-like family protein [Bacteroidales bacterium]
MEKFFDYFDERYRETLLSGPPSEDGPVITISRLTGCDARETASLVAEKLNSKYGIARWRWVDKDIIYATAKELNIDTQRVENYYEGIKLSNLSEMIMAFSGGFVSDLRVKKTIRDVVLSMCKEGYIVLVGRGGVSIARDIRDSLHIRLVAPFYWRVQNVMKKNKINIEEAEKLVFETDAKRYDLIQTFLEQKSINMDSLFDATLNRATFSIPQTADMIVTLFEQKVGRQVAERKKKKPVF